ncbi:hypothetical protein ACFPDQ_08465 [Pseudofrancisella aestuarii]|uniref:Uncharacterized protein n=1 Tax=Pseudofrancisella aestuarii TaxID=2670347 RepID=A0ABV9TFL3_9GAMM|nr:hypothetical protein [Pseudofrancisella aestuarii]
MGGLVNIVLGWVVGLGVICVILLAIENFLAKKFTQYKVDEGGGLWGLYISSFIVVGFLLYILKKTKFIVSLFSYYGNFILEDYTWYFFIYFAVGILFFSIVFMLCLHYVENKKIYSRAALLVSTLVVCYVVNFAVFGFVMPFLNVIAGSFRAGEEVASTIAYFILAWFSIYYLCFLILHFLFVRYDFNKVIKATKRLFIVYILLLLAMLFVPPAYNYFMLKAVKTYTVYYKPYELAKDHVEYKVSNVKSEMLTDDFKRKYCRGSICETKFYVKLENIPNSSDTVYFSGGVVNTADNRILNEDLGYTHEESLSKFLGLLESDNYQNYIFSSNSMYLYCFSKKNNTVGCRYYKFKRYKGNYKSMYVGLGLYIDLINIKEKELNNKLKESREFLNSIIKEVKHD